MIPVLGVSAIAVADTRLVFFIVVAFLSFLFIGFVVSSGFAVHNLMKSAEEFVQGKIEESVCDKVTKTCMAKVSFTINEKTYTLQKKIPYTTKEVKKNDIITLQYEKNDIENTIKACCFLTQSNTRGIISSVISIFFLISFVMVLIKCRKRLF